MERGSKYLDLRIKISVSNGRQYYIDIYTRESHVPDQSSLSQKIRSTSVDETMAAMIFCRIVM